MTKKMKCYCITDMRSEDEDVLNIIYVYAEKASKAKYIAAGEPDWSGSGEVHRAWAFRALRAETFDRYYKEGKTSLQWNDEEDRKILFDHGWVCAEPERWECENCPCLSECDDGKAWMDYWKGGAS